MSHDYPVHALKLKRLRTLLSRGVENSEGPSPRQPTTVYTLFFILNNRNRLQAEMFLTKVIHFPASKCSQDVLKPFYFYFYYTDLVLVNMIYRGEGCIQICYVHSFVYTRLVILTVYYVKSNHNTDVNFVNIISF